MLTIPSEGNVDEVCYEPEVTAICHVKGMPFHGTLHVTYRPTDTMLEYVAVEDWLASLATQQFTIESLCRTVFNKLQAALGDIPLRVELRARTTAHAPVVAAIENKEREQWKHAEG